MGCLAQEIGIKRGLKKGDSQVLLIFFLVVKGLSGLFSMAIELDLFPWLIMGTSDLVVSHFQNEGDTLILEDESMDNILLIKVIL